MCGERVVLQVTTATPEEKRSERDRRRSIDAALAELQRREDLRRHKAECEESFAFFVQMFWHVVEPTTPMVEGWPLELICDVLTSITDGHSTRDIINVPPGFMKSYLLNVFWPAWEWGPQDAPGTRYLCASYAGALAERDNGGDIGRFSRLINSVEYRTLWGDKFKVIKDNAGLVENNRTGSKRVVTMSGGATTGFRGDRICLAGHIRILTDEGWARIERLVYAQRPVRVAGWDGTQIVWQIIDAYEVNVGRQMVGIDYGESEVLECTVDHPIWVVGRGYVDAGEVRPGDRILQVMCPLPEAVPMQTVALGEKPLLLQDMPTRIPAGEGDPGKLKALRDVRSAGLQATVAPRTERSNILQQEVHGDQPIRAGEPGISDGDEAHNLRLVWQGEALQSQRGGKGFDLFKDVSEQAYVVAERQETARDYPLSGVRGGIQTAQPQDAILFGPLQEFGACQTNLRPRQRQVRSRSERPRISARLVPDLQSADQGERRESLSTVPHDGQAARQGSVRSSHRLREEKFGADESDDAVPILPWDDAREPSGTDEVAIRTVRSVRKLSVIPTRTFNLNVVPCHNYFAEGILTHNCIDDANNPLDVESDTVRATTNTWLREVMPSRTNHAERSAIINIQQRTHEDDATGVLAKHFKGYRWTCVPMQFDPLRMTDVVLTWEDDGRPASVWSDPRGTDENGRRLEGLFKDARGNMQLRPGSPMAKAEGALAWPERFSQETCDRLREALGEYAYEGQYQQSPGIRGGGIIRRDWWKPWGGEYPDLGTSIAILDTAVEEGEKNDWNALVTLGAFPGKEGEPLMMMTSAAKWRVQLAELVSNVAQICAYRKVDYLLIERKTRGKDVHDEIIRLFSNASWQTILVDVVGTKISRLKSVSHLFSGDLRTDPATGLSIYSGGVMHAPDRSWADEVIDQVSAFPRGSHDDYVDCISMGLGWVRKNSIVLRKTEWLEEEAERNVYRKAPSVPYAIRR